MASSGHAPKPLPHLALFFCSVMVNYWMVIHCMFIHFIHCLAVLLTHIPFSYALPGPLQVCALQALRLMQQHSLSALAVVSAEAGRMLGNFAVSEMR